MAGVAVPPPPPPPPPPPLPSLLAPSGSSSQLLNVAVPNQNGSTTASGLAMPGGGSGGSNGAKPWEKPWNPRELRENAAKWSLAGDSGLLLYLRDFSQRMLQRTHEMEKQVDDLVSDVKTSSVKAHNVFNEFAVLANTQFVENRVYEEDINVENQPPKHEERKEKTREEVEAELVPKVMQAVRLGIEVLEKSFVKLDPHVTGDSEDEDEPYQGDALYEPKDPYVNRPLPYLIGSSLFDESDDIGLRERPPEEAASDHGSISESDEEELSESAAAVAVPTGPARKPSTSETSTSMSESDSDTDEEDRPKPAKQTMPKAALPKQEASESEESGGLFEADQSDESDEETKESVPDASNEVPNKQRAAAPPMSFASELQRKLGLPPSTRVKSSSSEEESSSDRGKAVTAPSQTGADVSEGRSKKPKASADQKKSRSLPRGDSDEDLFKPPADDEEDLWIGGQASLFSAPPKSSLFSPESDLFGTPAEPPATKSAAVPKGTPSVQPAPIGTAPTAAAAVAATGTTQKVSKSKPRSDDLFIEDSDNDNDDDLFSSSAAAATKSKVAAEATAGSTRASAKPSASAKSVSEAAAAVKPSRGQAKSGLFDDDDDDDLFATINSTIYKKATAPAVSDVAAEQDNLFAETPKVVTGDKSTEQKSTKKFPAGAVPIFGNQPNPFAALHANRPPSQSDEDGENDSSALPPSRQTAPKATLFKSSEPVSQPAVTRTVKPPAPAGDLFGSGDDDEDDDLFAALSSPKKKETAKKASTLVLDPDEDGSAKDVVKAAPMPSVRPERSGSTKPAVLSLFGEGDEGEGADDADFLFSPAGSKSASASSKALGSSNASVAQLGASGSSKPTVPPGDLFGTASGQPPSQATTTKEAEISSKDSTSGATQQRTSRAEASKQRGGLFGSDEEDDLFAPKPSRSTTSSSSFGQIAAKPAVPKTHVAASAKVAASDDDPLFGSADAVATGTSDSTSKSQVKSVVSKPPVLPVLTTSNDDDEDGSLFSSPKVADKSAAASEKIGDVPAATVRKPAGAVPVLRGIDTAAIAKSKPTVADVVDPLAAVSLQPPNAGESRDDASLATRSSTRSSTEESLQTPTAAVAAAELPSGSQAEAERSSQAATAKPKKLAGAVSMFGGGLDPAALLKKADRSGSKDSPAVHSPPADTSELSDTNVKDKRPEPEAGGAKEVQDVSAPRPGVISASALASTQGSVAKRPTFSTDDDDDSIFSPTSSAVRSHRPVDGGSAAAAKVVPAPASKPAAFAGRASSATGSGLFGSPDDDDDDSAGLFGIVSKPPDTGTATLAKSRSDSASGNKALTEQPLTSAKQAETVPPLKATASGDQPKVRGMFDDDDEDDLFGSKRSGAEQPPPAAVTKTSAGQLPRKLPPAEASIFSDLSSPAKLGNQAATQKSVRSTDEVEDELFGTPKKVETTNAGPRLPVPDTSSAPAKKPPPGGVPMFGGAALPQLFGKRAAAAADTDAAPQTTVTATSVENESAAHRISIVDDAKSDKINAAADVDLFSRVASADGTLTSANKGRARVQQKRRPQSREARLLAAAQSPDTHIDGSSSSTVAEEEPAGSAPPTLTSGDVSGSPTQAVAAPKRQAAGKGLLPTGIMPSALAASSMFKKAKSGWDPDATDDGEDLFAPPDIAKVASLTSPAAVHVEKETSSLRSSRAGATDTSASSSSGRAKFRDLFGNDDLLGSGARDDNSTFEPSRSSARTVDSSAPVTVDTVAAATAAVVRPVPIPSFSEGTGTHHATAIDGGAKAVEPSGDLFSPADAVATLSGPTASLATAVHDDLFGSRAAVTATKVAPLVGMDDDDIFADASILKSAIPKASEQAAAAEPAASLDISQDATSASAIKKSSKKAAKPVTKVEDMFADDTDIFADLPTLPKVTTTKTKKQGQTSSKKKQEPAGNIFGDQEDDIFAPSSKTKASKTRDKSKEKTTAATVTSAKKTTEDFVDPLAADGGQ